MRKPPPPSSQDSHGMDMTHRDNPGILRHAAMGIVSRAVVKIEDNVLNLYTEYGEMKIDWAK